MEWEVNALVGILFSPLPFSLSKYRVFCFQEHLLRPFWHFCVRVACIRADMLDWVLGGCQVGAVLQSSVGNRRACKQGAFVGQRLHLALVVSAGKFGIFNGFCHPCGFSGSRMWVLSPKHLWESIWVCCFRSKSFSWLVNDSVLLSSEICIPGEQIQFSDSVLHVYKGERFPLIYRAGIAIGNKTLLL